MNIDISVIIVNYNCAAYILNCIHSVYEQTKGVSFEIIIVDNDSIDDSLVLIRTAFPEIQIIENGKNVGFGVANNIGAKQAKGDYLLLLNPDTILTNNALKLFYDYALNAPSHLACCGGNLLDERSRPANLGGNFPSLLQLFSDIGFRALYPRYYKQKISLMLCVDNLPDNKQVDCVCGADLFIQKAIFDAVGGFDEDYFLYYEDTDLCFRLKERGYAHYIVPAVRILHLESAAIADNRSDKLNARKFSFFEEGKQRFFKKSYGPFSVFMAKIFTFFYLCTRLIAHKGSIRQYLKMMGISLRMKLGE